jgi:hypothetical protein
LSFLESSTRLLLTLLEDDDTVEIGAALGADLGASLDGLPTDFLAVVAIIFCIK